MAQETGTRTVVEALLDEIERVSAKRARWRLWASEDGEDQALYMPGITLMTRAIDAAKKAITEDDGVAAVAALEELRGFDNND